MSRRVRPSGAAWALVAVAAIGGGGALVLSLAGHRDIATVIAAVAFACALVVLAHLVRFLERHR